MGQSLNKHDSLACSTIDLRFRWLSVGALPSYSIPSSVVSSLQCSALLIL